MLPSRRKDAIDHKGISRHNPPVTNRRALRREVLEETDFDLDTLPNPTDVFDLEPLPDQSPQHTNYVIYLKDDLPRAAPKEKFKWEIEENGVQQFNAVDQVPGGYHGWASLQWLENRPDLMEPCRKVIRQLIELACSKGSTVPQERRKSTSSANKITARACSVGTSAVGSGVSVPEHVEGKTSSASLVSAQVCTGATDNSERVRSVISYAKDFKLQKLRRPIEEHPFDRIREHIGRLHRVFHVPTGSDLKLQY